MAFDFQKLGVDRLAQNISRSVNKPKGNTVTGDITRGEVVEVAVGTAATAADTGTAKVPGRRVGAVLLGHDLLNHRFTWGIEGTTLTVTTSTAVGGNNFTFWVF